MSDDQTSVVEALAALTISNGRQLTKMIDLIQTLTEIVRLQREQIKALHDEVATIRSYLEVDPDDDVQVH